MCSKRKVKTARPSPTPRMRKALIKSTSRMGTWREEVRCLLVAKHSSAIGMVALAQKRISPLSNKSMNLREDKLVNAHTVNHLNAVVQPFAVKLRTCIAFLESIVVVAGRHGERFGHFETTAPVFLVFVGDERIRKCLRLLYWEYRTCSLEFLY